MLDVDQLARLRLGDLRDRGVKPDSGELRLQLFGERIHGSAGRDRRGDRERDVAVRVAGLCEECLGLCRLVGVVASDLRAVGQVADREWLVVGFAGPEGLRLGKDRSVDGVVNGLEDQWVVERCERLVDLDVHDPQVWFRSGHKSSLQRAAEFSCAV